MRAQTKKTPKVAVKPQKASNTKISAELRRKLFAEQYLTNGGNSTQAARTVGLSAKTATSAGERMLRHVEVAQIISSRRATLIEKYEITTERTLREIARLAYFDPRKLFHADGRPKSVTELDDDTAAAVAGLEVLEEFAGSGADRVLVGHTKKYKLADKNSALEKAMKHLGEYKADNLQRSQLVDMSQEDLSKFIERKAKEAGVTLH